MSWHQRERRAWSAFPQDRNSTVLLNTPTTRCSTITSSLKTSITGRGRGALEHSEGNVQTSTTESSGPIVVPSQTEASRLPTLSSSFPQPVNRTINLPAPFALSRDDPDPEAVLCQFHIVMMSDDPTNLARSMFGAEGLIRRLRPDWDPWSDEEIGNYHNRYKDLGRATSAHYAERSVGGGGTQGTLHVQGEGTSFTEVFSFGEKPVDALTRWGPSMAALPGMIGATETSEEGKVRSVGND